MCGFFGAVGPLPGDALDRASAALAHRGPDLDGRWEGDGVSLLHRRLKIIDLSAAAAQPMQNEDGAVQVVFNGEIYNHHALRRELEQAGHAFRSRSDTEVLVHGWEQWGEGLVARLDGMFAFAVWDRGKRTLLVARNRAGKKPLFFAESGGTFRFGSTVESLHAAGHPEGTNVSALPFYLAYGFVPPPITLHAGVRQLAPSEYLVLSGASAPFAPRIETYFAPAFRTAEHVDPYPRAAARVRSLVERAVERRLESDVPLGAFLSGGVDSTIVVGVMARALASSGQRVKTFSIGFAGDPRYDETRYARMAAKAFDTEHTEFTLEPSSFELVETLVRHHDGPFGDSSAIPTYVVSKLTREHVTVALSGDGGDELFCGYQRFLAAEAAERVPHVLRRTAARAAARLPTPSRDRSLWGKAARFLSASAMPLADRMARWNSYFEDPREILRADVCHTLGPALDAPLAWQREVFSLGRGDTVLSRVLEHNYRTYLPYDLLVKADRTSMAHGLEVRAPFLDDDLLAYVSGLPADYLRRGPVTKRVLKDAFADVLPPAIRTRGKMGFGVPLSTWFRGGLRDTLRDHLGPGAHVDAFLDRAALDPLLDQHGRSERDHSQRLWTLLTLEVWLRRRTEAIACAA